MEKKDQILGEITELTSRIQTYYPELYRFLDENPLTLPLINKPTITNNELKSYLESLQQLLDHYLGTHDD